MLRDALLHFDSVIVQTINFSYVFFASLLAFALTQEDTVYIMLSYIVIFPAYLIVLNKLHGICKIKGYLYTFHEHFGKTGFQWETNSMRFVDTMASKDVFSFNWITSFMYTHHFPFAMINIATFCLFIIRTKWENLDIYNICKIFICTIAFIFMLLLINENRKYEINYFTQQWICLHDLISQFNDHQGGD